jgi:hypothetical protein
MDYKGTSTDFYIRPMFCLSVCLSIYLSIYLTIYLSICLSIIIYIYSIYSITESCSIYCDNLQADHNSHTLLCYF